MRYRLHHEISRGYWLVQSRGEGDCPNVPGSVLRTVLRTGKCRIDAAPTTIRLTRS